MNSIQQDDYDFICSAAFIPWERLRGKSVLITGATGLIGHALTGALLYANEKRKLGMSVLALVRDEARARRRFAGFAGLDAPLRLLAGTVEDLPEAEGPVDYIVHGANQTVSRAFVAQPVETIRTALEGTKNVLELARVKACSGMVYLSSLEMYGHPPRGRKVKEEDAGVLSPLDVRNSYPISKLQCENLVCAYAGEYSVPASIVRLTQTIGPCPNYNDERFFAEIGRCVREKRDIVLRTKCESERPYLYAADAASAVLTVLLKGRPGQAYNAADESSYCSLAEMARRIAEMSGVQARFEQRNEREYGYPAPLFLDLDTSRLRALGWEVKDKGDALLRKYISLARDSSNGDEAGETGK